MEFESSHALIGEGRWIFLFLIDVIKISLIYSTIEKDIILFEYGFIFLAFVAD